MLRRVDSSVRQPRPRNTTGERDLVARAAGGDTEAQKELLVTHLPHVRRLMVRLCGRDGPEVDDLIQTACVEVLRSLSRFRGDASFALWIDRLATHVVYKHFRSSTRRRRRIRVVEDPELAGGQPVDEAARLEWRQAARQARVLIEELKPDRRIIFLLVAVDGRTVDEAAAMLDLGLSAAKSRYLRARREIDRRLAEQPELAEALGRLRKPAEGEEDGRG